VDEVLQRPSTPKDSVRRASFNNDAVDAVFVTDGTDGAEAKQKAPNVAIVPMPKALEDIVWQVFDKMDKDKGGTIDVREAQEFFSKTSFGKVSARAMFDAMDKDEDMTLSRAEWQEHFARIHASRQYDEAALESEIRGMLDGNPFTLFGQAPVNKAKRHST
jgi:hypothetical protein